MALTCYLASAHEHQSEEIAARTLIHELRQCLEPEETASLVCNVTLYGSQFDAVLFTEYAVTVIDWKASLGPISGGETGVWLRTGQAVLAGTFENPYQQILDKRLKLSSFLRKNAARLLQDSGERFEQRNYSQISATLVFIPTTPEHALSLPKTANSWFTLTGLDVAARTLTTHRSLLKLHPSEIETIIERAWACPRWVGLDTLLPNRAAGVLRYTRSDGSVHSREVLRSFTVGRGSESDWVLHPPQADDLGRVSRRHIQIHATGGEAVLYDLGSANGTSVNGRRLDPGVPCSLSYGDSIILGTTGVAGCAQLEFATGGDPGDDGTTYESLADPK